MTASPSTEAPSKTAPIHLSQSELEALATGVEVRRGDRYDVPAADLPRLASIGAELHRRDAW